MTEMETVSRLLHELWPLMRSLTGDGVRQTHAKLSDVVPLDTFEIPSGTEVFDWTVPDEWRFKEAYVIDPNGNRILDASVNTLHLVNYSMPFSGTVSLDELKEHLYTLPDQPNAIPYVTSYYTRRWGFCLSHNMLSTLPEGQYSVVVDTEFLNGGMTLSEIVLPGDSEKEVFFSTYTCHPSMANNELSGPLTASLLAQRLSNRKKRRYTYRFVFVPETIGAIAYLHRKGEHLKKNMVAGYVVTCTGLDLPFTYQKSRQGDSAADRAAEFALEANGEPFNVRDFVPFGSDERQYCSPGFNLPVGSLMRGPYNTYPEYHTSLDNLDMVTPANILKSVDAYEAICDTLEQNRTYLNLRPHCEPFLTKHNLYQTVNAATQRAQIQTILWLLNLSDSNHDLVAISKRSGTSLQELSEVATILSNASLLKQLD